MANEEEAAEAPGGALLFVAGWFVVFVFPPWCLFTGSLQWLQANQAAELFKAIDPGLDAWTLTFLDPIGWVISGAVTALALGLVLLCMLFIVGGWQGVMRILASVSQRRSNEKYRMIVKDGDVLCANAWEENLPELDTGMEDATKEH
jgi:hypothetical protein